MMKQYDVLLIGEALVDFVPEEGCIPGRFRAVIGGAPNNVACGLGKLGIKTALLARVGRDAMGTGIMRTVESCGVDTQYIQIDRKRPTTVTIVMPESADMLRYAIYRSESADSALDFDEIPDEIFDHTRILHYGSLAAAAGQSKKTMEKSIERAKGSGVITSLDVNLRPNSWMSEEIMIQECRRLVEVSDIVKMTKDEAKTLKIEPERLARSKKKVVIVTDGGNTATIWADDCKVSKKPDEIEVVDVTGGGDSFMSAFLYYYVTYKGKMSADNFYRSAIDFAVYASSISVQRFGAIESLPVLEEIEQNRR